MAAVSLNEPAATAIPRRTSRADTCLDRLASIDYDESFPDEALDRIAQYDEAGIVEAKKSGQRWL